MSPYRVLIWQNVFVPFFLKTHVLTFLACNRLELSQAHPAMARLLGMILLLLAGQQVLAAKSSDFDEMQDAMRNAQKLGAEYMAKKRGEAGVLKKAPSLIQMGGFGGKPMVVKKVAQDAVGVQDQPAAAARGVPSFNPFKPDPSLLKK